MAGTVKLPAIGEVPTKYAYAGVAVIVGIVGFAYYKRRQSASAASASTAAPDPNAVDPATGLTYAQEQAAGSVGSLGSTGYSNPNPNAVGYSTVSGTGAITTNMDWSAAVSSALGNLGYDPTFIASTIGKYLASQPLTADEAALIRVAWAYEGKPPSGPTNIVNPPTPTPVPTPPSRMSTKTDITVYGTTVGCGVHAVNGERGTGDAEYQYRGGNVIGWTTLTRIPLSAGAATLDLRGRLKPGNYSVRVAFHPSDAKFYPSVSNTASVTVK